MFTEKVAQLGHPERIVQFVRTHERCTGVTSFREYDMSLLDSHVIRKRHNSRARTQEPWRRPAGRRVPTPSRQYIGVDQGVSEPLH